MNCTIDTKTLRTIEAGAFREYYLIYNRKSTDEPNNQKNSLNYQRAENLRFAEKSGLSVASLSIEGFCTQGIIAERHSGFKEDTTVNVNKKGMVQHTIARPKFKQLITLLSRGYFKGIICLSWDRLSRNKADNAIISKFMRAGIDVRFAYAQYDNTSAGMLHMDIDGMFAAHHSRVTSEKVRITQYNLREQGICTHRAPIGYLNIGKSNDKPIDPIRGPIIRKMFTLYAQGNIGISELTRWANEQGLTSYPMRKRRTQQQMLDDGDEVTRPPKVCLPVGRGTVQRILSNPFYIGQTLGNHGLNVKSKSHKPLVSDKLFYQVQGLLGKKRPNINYAQRADMPFRKMIRCSQCGRTFTPYKTKGVHYLSVHCAPTCGNSVRNYKVAEVEKQIGDILSGFTLTDEEHAELDDRVLNEHTVHEEKARHRKEKNGRKQCKVREDLAYLQDNKLMLLKNGVYDAASLVAEENKLKSSLLELQEVDKGNEAEEQEILKDLLKLSELLKRAYFCYISANSFQKACFAGIVFSELSLSENTLSYKAKKGFQAFESRSDSLGGPTEWFSELSYPSAVRKSVVTLEKVLKDF
ncbi:recombinase family protein [Kordiimonas pumila]|uniref:Recombinase family protein n=1 Tax=Kordiimonas pumila TaxID=2161677 RepID=A0ABV7D3F7_9PROT|nr:recombinase family protein [Kordiimonas pumila]